MRSRGGPRRCARLRARARSGNYPARPPCGPPPEAVAHVRPDKPGGAGNDNSQMSLHRFILAKPAAGSHATFKIGLYMTDASWMERAVLARDSSSLRSALFWWRFRKVLHVIRRSRATPDFELSPLGPRIRQFLWEVHAAGQSDRAAAAARARPRLRVLGISAPSRWSRSTTSRRLRLRASSRRTRASAASISASSRCGRWRWRSRSPACSSAASSCGRSGWAKCRRNRASSRC